LQLVTIPSNSEEHPKKSLKIQVSSAILGFHLPAGYFRVQSPPVQLLEKLKSRLAGTAKPVEHQRGALGERAAKKHLQQAGLKYLTANFDSERGEIDLIFRDADCLVFVEVKTRSSEEWTRPASFVNARKRRLLSQTALDYLRRLKNPEVKIRFDIVEVLLADGAVREIRHLPNAFSLSKPYRYG
jgi:putative endonuclease